SRRVMTTATLKKRHLFEILAQRNHWVMEGPHAKGGVMHYWQNQFHPPRFTTISRWSRRTTPLRFPTTCKELRRNRARAVTMGNHRRANDRAAAVSIADIMRPCIKDNRGRLTRGIRNIDFDHPNMDYDTFIGLLCAICA